MFPSLTISFFKKHPKRLLFLDSMGALISAFCLGVLLVHYEAIFGIPVPTLYFLAVWPILFFVFDVVCILKKDNRKTNCIRAIAYMNIGYAILSVILTIYHFEVITIFGRLYLVGEITLVLFLAFFEFKIAKALVIPSL